VLSTGTTRCRPLALGTHAWFFFMAVASTAASVMNLPRCIAAQNAYTTSGSIRSENVAVNTLIESVLRPPQGPKHRLLGQVLVPDSRH